MDSLVDVLKAVLPVITFGAGFVLNAWLERRKRRNNRSETALRDLVTSLHEWHTVWRTLIAACRDATTPNEIDNAIENYKAHSTIAMRVDFAVSILRQDKRTSSISHIVDRKIADFHTFKANEVKDTSFDFLQKVLWHEVNRYISTISIFLSLPLLNRHMDENNTQQSIEDTKSMIGQCFSDFELYLVDIQRAAAGALASI